MSSLTTHQVVAGISALAVLAMLRFIGSIGQRIPVVDDFAYWLSIAGRVDYMRQGLIASKDVLYFGLIIFLFLSFTYLKLSAGRKTEPSSLLVGRYAAVFLGTVAFGYLVPQPFLTAYVDGTREKNMTLSKGSQAVMEAVQGPWKVTVYANVLDRRFFVFLPAYKNHYERSLFDQFARENPNLIFEYEYYFAPSENERLYRKHPGKTEAEIAHLFIEQHRLRIGDVLTPEDVDTRLDLASEKYTNAFHLEWDGKSALFRSFDDPRVLPDEIHISAALRRLVDGGRTIAYVTGHGERSVILKGTHYHQKFMSERTFRYSMINFGFDTQELTLAQPVPEDVDLLVLAAPGSLFPLAELHHLRTYLSAGRNLMIMGEPDDHALLNEIVSEIGGEFVDGRVVEPKEDYPEDVVFAKLADDAADGIWIRRAGEFSASSVGYEWRNGAAIQKLWSFRNCTSCKCRSRYVVSCIANG